MANQNRVNGAGAAVAEPMPRNLSAVVPHRPGEHGFSGVPAGATHSAAAVAQTSRRVYLVIQNDGAEHKISSFDGQAAAQSFIEELLAQGVSRETIVTFRGSKLAFEVTLRPVVSFGTP